MLQAVLGTLVLAVLLGSPCAAQGEHHVMTLCQLFDDLDSHNGKTVTVRAAYRYGHEVAGLYADPCEPPAKLDGHDIVPHVSTEFSGGSMSSRAGHRFETAIADSRTQPIAIIVTVTGIIQTGGRYSGKGPMRPPRRGFGHLGAFPAGLVIQEFDEVEVMQSSPTPTNFSLAKPKN
jgi:hypothetical protein